MPTCALMLRSAGSGYQACLLGRLALVFLSGLAGHGQERPSEPLLRLEVRFALNDCLEASALAHRQGEKIVANGGRLATVVSPSPTGQKSMLIGSDLKGKGGCWARPLGEEEFFDLAMDDSTIAVLTAAASASGAARIRLFDLDGTLREEITDHPDLFKVVLSEKRIFGVTRVGVVRDVRTRAARALPTRDATSAESSMYLAFSGGTVGVVDRRTGTVLSLGADSRSSFKELDHPALGSAKAYYASHRDTPGFPNLIISASSDGEGNSYLLAGGFNAQEGAPVLIYSARQKIAAAVRIPLTLGPNSAYQIPVSIAVDSDRLFLLDAAGAVTIFQLPASR